VLIKTSASKFAIVAVLLSAFAETNSDTFASDKTLIATVPAHVEWCSSSTFDAGLLGSPSGRDNVMEMGSQPILKAAFGAGAASIGHVYIRFFEPSGTQVTVIFCSVVPSALQTDDKEIAVTQVPETQVIADLCADPDECVQDITAVLKAAPYNLTDEQISDMNWRYATAFDANKTAETIIAALLETDSAPVAKAVENDQTQASQSYAAVVVERPHQ
jgi:hypothetical protein